jgi:HD superfamily phosphodiesterase
VLGADADLIEAAAWLHDIGYAPDLAVTGQHTLDATRHLRSIAAHGVRSYAPSPARIVATLTGWVM